MINSKDYLEWIEENIDNASSELEPDDFNMLMKDVNNTINH